MVLMAEKNMTLCILGNFIILIGHRTKQGEKVTKRKKAHSDENAVKTLR